jgi:phage-related protein
MTRNTRPISWIHPARRDFEKFPDEARNRALVALTVVAEGGKPDIAKPLSGFGSGVWELAIRARGDAWRVIFALQVDENIWVVHAFQKKSKRGIATPKMELDLVKERLKRLREQLSRNGH